MGVLNCFQLLSNDGCPHLLRLIAPSGVRTMGVLNCCPLIVRRSNDGCPHLLPEGVQGDEFDPAILRHFEGALDRFRAAAVAFNAWQAAFVGPATIAIHDDGDMRWRAGGRGLGRFHGRSVGGAGWPGLMVAGSGMSQIKSLRRAAARVEARSGWTLAAGQLAPHAGFKSGNRSRRLTRASRIRA